MTNDGNGLAYCAGATFVQSYNHGIDRKEPNVHENVNVCGFLADEFVTFAVLFEDISTSQLHQYRLSCDQPRLYAE